MAMPLVLTPPAARLGGVASRARRPGRQGISLPSKASPLGSVRPCPLHGINHGASRPVIRARDAPAKTSASITQPVVGQGEGGEATAFPKRVAAVAGMAVAIAAVSLAISTAPAVAYVVYDIASAGHMSLGQKLAAALRTSGIPDGVILTIISMLPVVELRGAIPVGHWMGYPPIAYYTTCVLGNMVPVPIILLVLDPLSKWLSARSALAARFFTWMFARARSKTETIGQSRWKALALCWFVAVPLPGTGAWTGALGGYILGLPFLTSFFSVLAGVMIAGVIMTLVCVSGWVGAAVAGAVMTAALGGAVLAGKDK